MNIKSKFRNWLNWLEITINNQNTEMKTDIDSISEAQSLKDELINVIDNIDYYIEFQTNKMK
jgi:hypothetical protein